MNGEAENSYVVAGTLLTRKSRGLASRSFRLSPAQTRFVGGFPAPSASTEPLSASPTVIFLCYLTSCCDLNIGYFIKSHSKISVLGTILMSPDDKRFIF